MDGLRHPQIHIHNPFALDVYSGHFFESVVMLEQVVAVRRDLYPSGLAICFHAGSGIDRITPKVVGKFCLAYG